MLARSDFDLSKKTHWPEFHGWLYEKLQAFHKAFSEAIKKLDADEYDPGDEN